MDTALGQPETSVLPPFDDFFRSTFAPVARAAALVARDAGVGQELAQEAFFRLYERGARIESEEHARRFAYRVAINLARSHLRKHVRVALSGLDPARGRSQSAETNDAWLSIVSSLGDLSPAGIVERLKGTRGPRPEDTLSRWTDHAQRRRTSSRRSPTGSATPRPRASGSRSCDQ